MEIFPSYTWLLCPGSDPAEILSKETLYPPNSMDSNDHNNLSLWVLNDRARMWLQKVVAFLPHSFSGCWAVGWPRRERRYPHMPWVTFIIQMKSLRSDFKMHFNPATDTGLSSNTRKAEVEDWESKTVHAYACTCTHVWGWVYIRRYRTTSCFQHCGPKSWYSCSLAAWSGVYNFVLGFLWNRGLRGLGVTPNLGVNPDPATCQLSYCKFLYSLCLSFLINTLGIMRVLLQSSAVIAKYVNIHSALRKFPGTQYIFNKYLVLLFSKWLIALL